MEIKKIVLYKFKRFFLSGVDMFVYEPTRKISIMNWRNGMGKSSFLSQISPLPADLKKDFYPEGYKYINIIHKGKDYVISSGYIGPNKHSFVVDGIELNEGFTSGMQKRLSEEHFGITQEILEILLDKNTFTTMSPSIRKYWFSKLSPIDYKYIIGVYNNIKIAHRDNQGANRILTNDLENLNKSMVTKDVIDKLESDSIEIQNIISELSNCIDTRTIIINPIDIKKTLDRLYTNNKLLIGYSNNMDYYNSTRTDIANRIAVVDRKIIDLDNSLKDKYTKLRELEKTNLKLDYDKLKNRQLELNEYITANKDNNYNYDNYDLDVVIVNERLEKINSLFSKFNTVEIKNAKVGQDKIDLENKMNKCLENIEKIKLALYNNNNKKEELSAVITKPQLCPKCGHDVCIDHKEQLKLVIEKIANLEKLQTELNEKLAIYKKDLEYSQAHIDIKNNILDLISVSELKRIVYEHILEFGMESLPTAINKLLSSMEINKIVISYMKELKDIEDKMYLIKLAEDTKQKYGEISIISLEEEINKITIEKNKYIQELNILNKVLNIKNDMFTINEELLAYRRYIWSTLDKKVTDDNNRFIREAIGNLKLKLDDINNKIQKISSDKKTILDYTNKLEKIKNDNEVYEDLMDLLSPESGLIASSINSFLNVFLREMNSLINSVWSYDMKLLPCEVEDSDLSYKFKVMVNYDEVIEDISKLSSSMQEIVNLAFKIIFTKYLGIMHYPLVLDEYTKTMDEEHRISAYDVVSKILADRYKHIFIVSHYESIYSRFSHVDFIELKEYENEERK